ncbi:hypothetical protein B566_EDAN001302 [Ephemera danica]|nr:hypothetical protein B566_EDAN001302 [Ephemera danica]
MTSLYILLCIFSSVLISQIGGVVINAPVSQEGIKGDVRLSQDYPDGDVTVRVALDFTEGNELQDLGWQIREFPVDYQVINGHERCSPERLGNVVVDLAERLGALQLPRTAEFVIPGGYLNISGTNGMWGRSLYLHGPRTACSTLMVEGEERIAEARFTGPLAGTVLFRWFGAADGIDAIIFSNLLPVTEKSNDVNLHNWKIYVTDVLESEADKARDDCNALQLVFDPHNRGASSLCSPQNPLKCRAGDLDLRLGQLRSGGRHFVRDLWLPELSQSSADSPRSLYLAIFDPVNDKNILSCSRMRRIEPKVGVVALRGSGFRADIRFEQKSQFDLTHITINNVSSLYSIDMDDLEYNIHEWPVRGGTIETCKLSGKIFDPLELKDDQAQETMASHDKYAIGRLKMKHGPFLNLNASWDSFLPLFGTGSIMHRSFYAKLSKQREELVACGTVLPIKPLITAQALFRFPVVGRVLFRQIEGQPWSDTTILFEYLVYADGNQNDTADLKWKIHENIAGADYYNWSARCLSAGGTFNPYKVITSEDETYCFPGEISRCALGDLSTRHSKILAVGNKENMIVKTRRLFTDSNLRLSGSGGIVGRSLVLFHENGPKARGERLACTTINWLHRQKAVVKNWFGNGDDVTVSGKLEMIQLTEYDLTDVEVSLKGLDDNAGYHVHVAPLEIHLSFPCEDSTVYGHWNPYDVHAAMSPSPGQGTPDQYEMGDLSGKFGTLANLSQIATTYNDTNLDLIGTLSVIGRCVVIHKAFTNKRWACSNVERGYAPSEARELRAIASFHHPDGYAYGYIRMTQLVYNDGSASNTAIEVKLRHPGVNDRNFTKNHNWAIFVNPVGHDAAVKPLEIRCVAGGYRWNPYFTQLADPFNDELYRQQCAPENPYRCHVGDLSGRLGTIDLGGKRQSFTDINLPLEGVHSALGKSIVIYTKERGSERYACANIEPDNDIIKYANIRKPPRFEVSQFLDRVREVMGLPEWMLTIDNRKTKELHDGNCIQLLLHFRGAIANKLEQDFSRLINTGSLAQPSLFIHGVHTSNKRPKSLSYRQCGVKDPSEKSRRNNNAPTHFISVSLIVSCLFALQFNL